MKELVGIVTRKGQVTVPAEIREVLGLKQGDRVAFLLDGQEVRLTPSDSVIARTAGALKSEMPALSPRAEREAFERGVAEEVMEKLGG